MSNRDKLEELVSSLKQQRDQIALKIHLGAKESQEEWEKAKDKMDELLKEYEPVKDATEESASEIWTSLTLVGEEVKKGFNRIWSSL